MRVNRLMKILLILIVGLFSGCHKAPPKPEAKQKNVSMNEAIMVESIHAVKQINEETPSLFVKHQTKDHNVFVECIVTGVSFRGTDPSQQKTGKMIVWIDGKKRDEVSQAAFMIKQLPNGNHLIKLEVVSLQNNPYGLSKEFLVKITKDQQ